MVQHGAVRLSYADVTTCHMRADFESISRLKDHAAGLNESRHHINFEHFENQNRFCEPYLRQPSDQLMLL